MGKYFDCPGCDRWINEDILKDNNNCCPHCGLSYDDTNKVESLKMGYICPKCANICSNVWYRNHSGICEYCGTNFVKTDMTVKELYDATDEDYIENKDYARIIANKYGDFQFSDIAYDNRIQKQKDTVKLKKEQSNNSTTQSTSQQPQITCPYCKSTNTKKISTASRIGSIVGFGIFSKKVGKQLHCNSCGSDF